MSKRKITKKPRPRITNTTTMFTALLGAPEELFTDIFTSVITAMVATHGDVRTAETLTSVVKACMEAA